MLEAILADREGRSVSAIAADIGLPRATAHRQVTTLVAEQFLARMPDDRLGPGARLLSLLRLVDDKQMIASAAAPILHDLATKLGCVVQLGTLENDMVTYRIKTGLGAGELFTKVGLQLEAYCTGIGKVLLSHLPEIEREAYLATGPFPALTTHTITDPALLRAELATVREQGFALDREEIAEGITCVAVPIVGPDLRVSAAISVSRAAKSGNDNAESAILEKLRDARHRIELTICAKNGQPSR